MDHLEKFKQALFEKTKDKNLSNYIFCGGSKEKKDSDYFFEKNPLITVLPNNVNDCLCGHDIKNNFYIQHKLTKEIFIVGSCCIKKWLPKENQKKTCSECGERHRNRIVDLCNSCRPRCSKCSGYVKAVVHCAKCKINIIGYYCPNIYCDQIQDLCKECEFQKNKKCIGCIEINILMPQECNDCGKRYWVCPKDSFRRICKSCYSNSMKPISYKSNPHLTITHK